MQAMTIGTRKHTALRRVHACRYTQRDVRYTSDAKVCGCRNVKVMNSNEQLNDCEMHAMYRSPVSQETSQYEPDAQFLRPKSSQELEIS